MNVQMRHDELWLSPEYYADATTKALRQWFSDPVAKPLSLKNFIYPDKALALGAALQEIRSWQRNFSIITSECDVQGVDERTWNATEPSRRWNRHDKSIPGADLSNWSNLSQDAQGVIVDAFIFLFGEHGMKTWLERVTGFSIGQATCEVVRYHQGDFLAAHSDTHDNRCIGLNIYLDHLWKPADGGLLNYKNEQNQTIAIEPTFNTASVFPVRFGCVHWVERWNSDRVGRQTISLSYAPNQS